MPDMVPPTISPPMIWITPEQKKAHKMQTEQTTGLTPHLI
jgi:hypothetical protein